MTLKLCVENCCFQHVKLAIDLTGENYITHSLLSLLWAVFKRQQRLNIFYETH